MLTMVLESVNLPVAGIGLVIGVDRIFDMGRTTVNITGDAACALVVSNLEKKAEARRLPAGPGPDPSRKRARRGICSAPRSLFFSQRTGQPMRRVSRTSLSK